MAAQLHERVYTAAATAAAATVDIPLAVFDGVARDNCTYLVEARCLNYDGATGYSTAAHRAAVFRRVAGNLAFQTQGDLDQYGGAATALTLSWSLNSASARCTISVDSGSGDVSATLFVTVRVAP